MTVIGLQEPAKDVMLQVFNGPLAVGLFNGEDEIVDPRYQRQLLEFSEPISQGDVRFIENVNDIHFEDMGADHKVTHWGVFAPNGELIALYRLDEARDMPAEDNAVFRPGRLTIGMP